MNTLVDVVMGECESIIAETENVTESFTAEECDTLDSFLNELYEIRCSAEALNELVVHLQNDYFSVSKEELDDESITLYQNIKYSLEAFENEYESMMTDEIAKSFSYMRASIDTIRNKIV
jgi:hypothetical protein